MFLEPSSTTAGYEISRKTEALLLPFSIRFSLESSGLKIQIFVQRQFFCEESKYWQKFVENKVFKIADGCIFAKIGIKILDSEKIKT